MTFFFFFALILDDKVTIEDEDELKKQEKNVYEQFGNNPQPIMNQVEYQVNFCFHFPFMIIIQILIISSS